ncbi:hypothetical protein QH637_17310 [Heyndrickxia coagulans]
MIEIQATQKEHLMASNSKILKKLAGPRLRMGMPENLRLLEASKYYYNNDRVKREAESMQPGQQKKGQFRCQSDIWKSPLRLETAGIHPSLILKS